MKVIEHLQRAKEPLLSFEIVPPQRGGDFRTLEELIATLAQFHPPFIDVTSHAAQPVEKNGQKVRRKRPGTLGVCAVIQHKYGIDAVPHVLCNGFTREETEDFLIDLNYLGIQNVLALRGDKTHEKLLSEGRTKNEYAVDLVKQIVAMNKGRYLDDSSAAVPSDFCLGVAGYPEKHVEAPHFEVDLRHLYEKVKAGADYIVTQMFFDNQKYFNFVKKCCYHQIEVPIIPGLKVLTSKEQLTSLPQNFYLEIPGDLVQQVELAKDKKEVLEVGVQWAVEQAEELLNHNVPAVHFYVMGNPAPVVEVITRLQK